MKNCSGCTWASVAWLCMFTVRGEQKGVRRWDDGCTENNINVYAARRYLVLAICLDQPQDASLSTEGTFCAIGTSRVFQVKIWSCSNTVPY